MKYFIQQALADWAYKVNDGCPDPQNRSHIQVLESVLRQYGCSEDFISEYLPRVQRLDEDDIVKNKKTKNVYTVKNHNKDTQTLITKDASKNQIKNVDGGDVYLKAKIDDPSAGKKISKNGVRGNLKDGDNKDQDDVLKYGYDGMEAATGRKAAPGNNGSAFNEVVSGQGTRILYDNPNMTEEDLIEEMFETFGQTTLGKLQSKTSGIVIPYKYSQAKKDARSSGDKKAIKEADQQIATYTKCAVAARSAITKHKTSTSRVKALQKSADFGKPNPPQTFYGTEKSLQSQKDAVDEADKVILPSGIEVSKDDAKKFIDMGGGGANPSDTATFISDDKGNLLIQFHSDKTSTSDIQGSKTVSAENKSVLNRIQKNTKLSTEQKEQAVKVVEQHNRAIREIEDGYKDQTVSVAAGLKDLPVDKQVEAIQAESKKVGKDYLSLAVIGKTGVKSKYTQYIPDGADPDNLTEEQKYIMVRAKVADGNGEGNDFKVISKVTKRVAGEMDEVPEQINISKILSKQRKIAVETIRQRRDELDKIEPGPPPLGVEQESEETISGFHLGVIDDVEYDANETDESARMGAIMNSSFDVNMGGVAVNKATLRKALGVNNTDELRAKFNVREAEEFTYADKDKTIVTGKKVYTYVVNKDDGEELELGYKTYRSTDGATGKSRTTIQFATEFQKKLKEVQ
tara:strand:- start:345 stop:2399 length:2055 start_codon:yes stop_codon:yes gene_type:complete